MRIGVLVPARDEAAVVGRKLANLARCEWPEGGGAPHRVVVVDDGSTDGTAGRARAAAAGRPPFELDVAANGGPPGKAGAVATGLALLGARGGVDLVVLTDADVVLREGSLAALAAAFAREPGLAMASAAQEVVRDLAADGTCRAADLGPPVPAAGLYDRITARVRAFESRAGRLFSVHGQCLAWRASLDLRPSPGLAADDLDLMLQARAAGGRVRLVRGARFLEARTGDGVERGRQELRRARAFHQAVRRGRGLGTGALDRLQWAFYRRLPAAAPWLALAICVLAPVAGLAAGGARGLLAASLAVLALVLSPPGRRLARLLATIARAELAERRGTLSDRWEMRRT